MDDITEELRLRTERARAAADAAVAALGERGIRAELIGSLARGEYGLHSDVDLLVPWDRKDMAIVLDVCFEAFGDVEYDLVNARTVSAELLATMRREAVSAEPHASVPRRMAVLARSVADMVEASGKSVSGWDAAYDRLPADLRRMALSTSVLRHAEVAVERMVKVARRMLVDGRHFVPHGLGWEERTLAACVSPVGGDGVPILDDATAGRLRSLSERAHGVASFCDVPADARAFADEVEAVHAAFVAAVDDTLARVAVAPAASP